MMTSDDDHYDDDFPYVQIKLSGSLRALPLRSFKLHRRSVTHFDAVTAGEIEKDDFGDNLT